jgi:hypothetical protein
MLASYPFFIPIISSYPLISLNLFSRYPPKTELMRVSQPSDQAVPQRAMAA